MKRIVLILTAVVLSAFSLAAQNDKGDNIIGTYISEPGDDQFMVRITKEADGTYTGQICWVKYLYDEYGQVIRDKMNPDESLRDTPLDKIVIFKGLKYNAKRQKWGNTKVYEPTRGITSAMTASFKDPTHLKVKGTAFAGIGETQIWTKSEL